VKPGMDLGVGFWADGHPRLLEDIEVFMRTLDFLAAGCQPIRVALGWRGHLQLEVGRVLTVASPSMPT
jgi:hypothetical protein